MSPNQSLPVLPIRVLLALHVACWLVKQLGGSLATYSATDVQIPLGCHVSAHEIDMQYTASDYTAGSYTAAMLAAHTALGLVTELGPPEDR